MIKYTVKISDKAQADMEQIYSYIAKELMSPRNALGQYKRITEGLKTDELKTVTVEIKDLDLQSEEGGNDPHNVKTKTYVLAC